MAIAHGLGISFAHIRSGLKSLDCSHADTPGRLDFIDGFAFQVILDYAHNAPEIRAVSAVIGQLDCPGRRIVAFASPGSRAGASKLEQGEMISGDRLGEMQAAFIAARYTSDEIGRLPTVAPNHG